MPRCAVAGAGLQTVHSICSTPQGQPGQMPRSTAEISSYSLAWVGVLALLPVGSGFDLFRAASQSPTTESDTVGRRLASSCDASCDGCQCDGWGGFTSCGCDAEDANRKSCDSSCDDGCSDCASRGKVGRVGECTAYGNFDVPTAGQCCTCTTLYVRNTQPIYWTNPQASKEGAYPYSGSGYEDLRTPMYNNYAGYVAFNQNGQWFFSSNTQMAASALIRSRDANTDPNACPEDLAGTWQVRDYTFSSQWTDAPYLYVGCDPPPSPPPSPPPPPPPSPLPPPSSSSAAAARVARVVLLAPASMLEALRGALACEASVVGYLDGSDLSGLGALLAAARPTHLVHALLLGGHGAAAATLCEVARALGGSDGDAAGKGGQGGQGGQDRGGKGGKGRGGKGVTLLCVRHASLQTPQQTLRYMSEGAAMAPAMCKAVATELGPTRIARAATLAL